MTPDTFEVLSMTHSDRGGTYVGTLIAAATIAFLSALLAVPRFVGAERTNITRWTLLAFPLHRWQRFLAVV